MATVTIQIVAGAQTYTNTRTITSAHLLRFIEAYKRVLDTPSSPSSGLTDEQVVNRWANDVFASARELVLQQETQVAVEASTAGITAIEFT